jgi:hypothetical protein
MGYTLLLCYCLISLVLYVQAVRKVWRLEISLVAKIMFAMAWPLLALPFWVIAEFCSWRYQKLPEITFTKALKALTKEPLKRMAPLEIMSQGNKRVGNKYISIEYQDAGEAKDLGIVMYKLAIRMARHRVKMLSISQLFSLDDEPDWKVVDDWHQQVVNLSYAEQKQLTEIVTLIEGVAN